ncbi:MAG: energy transducer TonB [Nitrospirae bacterium]|nr:energy transducer TonB [Nitrospirota bacterium]
MGRSAPNRVVLVAGFLGAMLCQTVSQTFVLADISPVVPQTPASGKRWVAFDFANPDASGDIQVGKPLELSIALGGVAQGHVPLVAICESIYFQQQTVMLEPDPLSMVMKATATLEPIPPGKLSVNPKVARIQVTFARVQKEKTLERVMRRIVYVTFGKQEAESDTSDLPLSARDEPGGTDTSQDEIQPDANPIASGLVLEEDLLPLPTPGRGQAYWQQVSQLVSRSWSRTVRRVRHSPSSETVRVRFRLYPSGRAQLIVIEKGSGAREIDEAGIYAVAHAQPFPPFPDDVGSEPVDVHVRMRTGAKVGAKEPRAVANPQMLRPSSGTITPKK